RKLSVCTQRTILRIMAKKRPIRVQRSNRGAEPMPRRPGLSYPSVDKLQNTLASEVFTYCTDKKKASGRTLGTLVEIVTFYTLCAWGLRDHVAIERSVPEFANEDVRHNVEFSLHPIVSSRTATI